MKSSKFHILPQLCGEVLKIPLYYCQQDWTEVHQPEHENSLNLHVVIGPPNTTFQLLSS